MMNNWTGTTDQSSVHSNTLEDLESEAESVDADTEQILRKVTDFARTNFQLQISEEQLGAKIAQIKSSVNLGRVASQLDQIAVFTQQIDNLQ